MTLDGGSGGSGGTVTSTVYSYSLAPSEQDLILSGPGAFNGYGNALNNSILGNSNNNVLDGGGGNDVQISVNMSPLQFKFMNKFSWLEELERLGLPGNCINVEITESLLLKDSSVLKYRSMILVRVFRHCPTSRSLILTI